MSESNKTPVIWQGSRIRCNTFRHLQSRRSPSCRELTELFHIMWRKEAIPQEFKAATSIHLFKRKGNPQDCDNHRSISLLSIAGKILARVLLNRLNEHLEQSGLLPESQCGFRKDRGTIDVIFTARQLGKCREQNVDLCMTFVDLSERSTTASGKYMFTYLGSTLFRVVHIDDEVSARIAKANAAFWPTTGKYLRPRWN